MPALVVWERTGGLTAEDLAAVEASTSRTSRTSPPAFEGIDGLLLAVTATVVLVILVAVHRSPVFVPVLLAAGLALGTAQAAAYLLATDDLITLSGQGSGILLVLVFGAGTDYALLLISRFKEELQRHERSRDAMRVAWRATVGPVVASGPTVVLGLLCLLLSDLDSTKSLGPTAATGGVITSAGVVLAATFSALGVLPLVPLAQIGFAVAFGVLLDTLGVRSLLVPSLTYLIGPRTWWPGRLARVADGVEPA